jgi:hypothetical protein
MIKFIKIKRVISLLLLAAACNYCMAQTLSPDSTECNKAAVETVALYTRTVGIQARVYNGYDYRYERIHSGHVFFETDEPVKGTLLYDRIEYNDVPILYDIVKDEVVVQSTYLPYFILLAGDKISAFSLPGHSFIRIMADSVSGTVMQTGFYQNLYTGKTKAWVKNTKIIEDVNENGNAFTKRAAEKDKWFVFKKGTYYEVQGKSSVLNVFGDKKKEIQHYCKLNKIRFKNNMDNALARIAAYYDKEAY